jgi:hypothetical protein
MTTTAGLLHEGTPLMQRRAAVAMASKDVSPPMLARCAAEALRDEAMLTPKPALADLRGDGAHRDLSVDLLLWSAKTLEPHFQAMAETAWEQPLSLPLRERLGHFGRVAEVAMLEASGGVNTHRGAIWAIGLMVAAAAQGPALEEESVCRRAGRLAALPDRFGEAKATHGSEARRCYGAGGAREEAVCAFPHVLQAGLPALRRARQAGIAEECARLDAQHHGHAGRYMSAASGWPRGARHSAAGRSLCAVDGWLEYACGIAGAGAAAPAVDAVVGVSRWLGGPVGGHVVPRSTQLGRKEGPA